MRMRISALVLGALLAVGCSSAANKKLDELADRACACTDDGCGKKVMNDFISWANDNKDARGDEGAAEKSLERMQACLTKVAAKRGAKAGKLDEPAGDKAAGDKAAGDKPAADKPAADKPAAEPAAEKPAADKPAEK